METLNINRTTTYRGYRMIPVFNYGGSVNGRRTSDWQLYPPGNEVAFMLPFATYAEACEYVNDLLNSQEHA